MNKTTKILALVLVMVMCIGLFTACGGDTNSTEGTKPSGTKPAGTTAAPEQDIVGVVLEVSDTFLKLDLCQKEAQGQPVTSVGLMDLKATGEIDYVYLNTGAVFAHYTNGELKDLKKADLSVGDIVVVTKTPKGVQQIVIMNYEVATPSEPTNPTESKG